MIPEQENLYPPAPETTGPANPAPTTDQIDKSIAVQLMDKAADAVGKDRGASHGTMRENFEYTAQLWSAWLGHPVKASDVAAMNQLQKMSRSRVGDASNPDHYVDNIGYGGIFGVLSMAEAQDAT